MHFNPQLSCCFPISPVNGQVIISDERNIMIGDAITNCETTVNERNNRGAPALADHIRVYFNGDALVVEGLAFEQNLTAELITLDGKVIQRSQVSGSQPLLFSGTLPPLATGLYLVRLFNDNLSLTKKVVIRL
jgi:hypothetical protein